MKRNWWFLKKKKLLTVYRCNIPHANRGYNNYLNEIDNVAKKCAGLDTGSAAIDLGLVASGKTDLLSRNLKLWDMCSGVLIVKEAGGLVTQQMALNGQSNQLTYS